MTATHRTTCRRGHAMTPENTARQSWRAGQCRTCLKNRRRARSLGLTVEQYLREQARSATPLRKPGGNVGFRRCELGKVRARGPLDYDVPVVIRCDHCGNLFARPLDAIGEPCPHCRRYPEAA